MPDIQPADGTAILPDRILWPTASGLSLQNSLQINMTYMTLVRYFCVMVGVSIIKNAIIAIDRATDEYDVWYWYCLQSISYLLFAAATAVLWVCARKICTFEWLAGGLQVTKLPVWVTVTGETTYSAVHCMTRWSRCSRHRSISTHTRQQIQCFIHNPLLLTHSSASLSEM